MTRFGFSALSALLVVSLLLAVTPVELAGSDLNAQTHFDIRAGKHSRHARSLDERANGHAPLEAQLNALMKEELPLHHVSTTKGHDRQRKAAKEHHSAIDVIRLFRTVK